MRNAFILALFLLGGCALFDAASTGKPIDRAQAQQDFAASLAALKEAGCLTAALGTVAAPIVAVAADDQGGKVLTVVNTAGTALCSIAAPAAIASPAGTTLGAIVTP